MRLHRGLQESHRDPREWGEPTRSTVFSPSLVSSVEWTFNPMIARLRLKSSYRRSSPCPSGLFTGSGCASHVERAEAAAAMADHWHVNTVAPARNVPRGPGPKGPWTPAGADSEGAARGHWQQPDSELRPAWACQWGVRRCAYATPERPRPLIMPVHAPPGGIRIALLYSQPGLRVQGMHTAL